MDNERKTAPPRRTKITPIDIRSKTSTVLASSRAITARNPQFQGKVTVIQSRRAPPSGLAIKLKRKGAPAGPQIRNRVIAAAGPPRKVTPDVVQAMPVRSNTKAVPTPTRPEPRKGSGVMVSKHITDRTSMTGSGLHHIIAKKPTGKKAVAKRPSALASFLNGRGSRIQVAPNRGGVMMPGRVTAGSVRGASMSAPRGRGGAAVMRTPRGTAMIRRPGPAPSIRPGGMSLDNLYASESDDWIDTDFVEEKHWRSEVQSVTGYNSKKYKHIDDGDVPVASSNAIRLEEARAERTAIMEERKLRQEVESEESEESEDDGSDLGDFIV